MKISDLVLTDDALSITFEDGSKKSLVDAGQSCCESRYLTTDDNLSDYIGAEYLGYEEKPAEYVDEGYDVHEIMFLDVNTSKGTFQIKAHNEHNGYYGGFWIKESN